MRRTRIPLVFAAATVAACLVASASAQAVVPPWGQLAYVAELAVYVDEELATTTLVEVGPLGIRLTTDDVDGRSSAILLTWDGESMASYTLEEGAFEPAPGLEQAVLASVLAPGTPELGICAAAGTTCTDDGEEVIADRPTRRLVVDQGEAGTSMVWVDRETGLTIRSAGTFGEVTVRSRLVRLDIGEPDVVRFRP